MAVNSPSLEQPLRFSYPQLVSGRAAVTPRGIEPMRVKRSRLGSSERRMWAYPASQRPTPATYAVLRQLWIICRRAFARPM